MGVKRGRESGSDGGEVEYEKLRNDRLRENQKRMEELGLVCLSKSLSESVRGSGRSAPRIPSSISRVIVPAGPARRSSRLSGSPAISYAENRVKRESEGKERKASRRASEAGTGGYQPEIYTEEHEKLLGDAKTEWQLFVDGYGAKGDRIYDPVTGKTCHQCRQKTAGLRTSCSNCQSLRGQFCGDCLYMRYGENVLEANKNENWECPVCRNICNCSFCRAKRGWTPTGALYRRVKSLGYQSVAHYLIFTRRGDDDEYKADEEVVPKDGDTKVKKAMKAGKIKKEFLVEEGGAPEPQMHIEDPLSAEKQETATLEADDEKAPVKPISAKVEVANVAPELKVPKLEVHSLVSPKPITVKLEKPVKLEKVSEVQATLLSAGFRSRRALSTRLKEGEKQNNLKGSNSPVQVTNVAENEPADLEVKEEEPKNRRGRPRRDHPSGKASAHRSALETQRATKPEFGMPVLVLDSDSEGEDFDDSDYSAKLAEGVTIAQRLRRRRVA